MLPRNRERPPPQIADGDLSKEQLPGQLGKEFNASRRRSQGAPRIPRQRLALLTRRVYALGERPLLELFVELEAGADLHERLERYAALPADFIKQLGGDRLPIARVVKPSRDEGGRR